MKHTPGPWTARLNSWVRWEIHYADGQLAVIAKPDDPASPPPVSETEANARLIAAAPELLEALEPFAKFACDSPHVNEPICHNCRARDAIAKAQS